MERRPTRTEAPPIEAPPIDAPGYTPGYPRGDAATAQLSAEEQAFLSVEWGEALTDAGSEPTVVGRHPLSHVQDAQTRHEPLHDVTHDLDTARWTSEPERYEPGELLGSGGMGEVRLCRDQRLGREVALKSLHLGPEATRETRLRFLREVRIQGRLEHPSVVPVYDLAADADGGLYFTMRRIRGMTLHDVLRGLVARTPAVVERFSRRKLLTAMASVCLTIHYAHTRGVLHRDLKPGNIMFGDFGEVYVIDWGIAKVMGEADDGTGLGAVLTRHGDVIGTAGYMAPEQFAGYNDQLDARADVYALGAILYEVLALRPLIKRKSLAAALDATLTGVDARASAVNPDVPPELDAVVARAVALDPDQRYPTARDLADAIERFLDR